MSVPTNGLKQHESKPKTTLTPFREFPRLFRQFLRLFREIPPLFLPRLCSKNGNPQFDHEHGCKAMSQVGKGLEPPNQVQANASHNAPIGTVAEIMAQMILFQVFFVPSFHDGPGGQTSKQHSAYSKYEDYQKTSLFLNMYK